MSSANEIQVIALLISVACALPGVFLVLRSYAMLSDAISHTVLLGITLMYFWVKDLHSPLLLLGATAMGLFTLWACQTLAKLPLLHEDSALALVFPCLFAIAIVLITKYFSNTALCVDSVLMGDLVFAPFQRLVILGHDLGPKGMYQAGFLLLGNILFLSLCFKELQITTFDPILAGILGFSPLLIHYALMTVLSLTAVSAFDTVGSVLVLAFLTVPANTAYLLTANLAKMLWLSGFFAGISAIVGFQVAYALNLSISGMMALVSGGLFLLVFFLAPKKGFLSHWLLRKSQETEFAELNLLFHVGAHQNSSDFCEENGIDSIKNHLYWDTSKLNKTISSVLKKGELELREDVMFLTQKGEDRWLQSASLFFDKTS